ncbi:maleylpyruvate isomerase N-terminal domain-containing protein [Brachybacterium sp. J144]|uniref:maleylpyruvate isomerase N-terminal domain-containing protein n=1 Tax=Brachybacterium sp. J144 TaxID=3116487 RepID=UPI002E7A1D94|nr:maleylpyruvate isomerase N-terminal domain-containing protein [Brachybacterium sp. J144]MEE1649679.1 maleylpyruvate isomerase N-terminal domain-containing protein [Brachybacterium sp. J144]
MSIDAHATIAREADRLAAVLARADPAARVPTCPDWTADDLLWHLTEVHEFWAAILREGVTSEEEVQRIEEAKSPRPEDREELLARRAAATAALLDQLGAHEDEDPAWFWFSEVQGVGATRRMQPHEATVHRVDAELTADLDQLSPIAPEDALAGLDHVLQVMWPAGFEWIPDWATLRPVAVVEIAPAGDEARQLLISRWSGTRPRDGQEFDAPVGRPLADPADADGLPRARAAGTPQALDLWAWGRVRALDRLPGGPQTVDVDGDPEAVAQLEALIAEGHD